MNGQGFSRKTLFLMFIVVNVVCNYFWDNTVDSWRILAYQAWAVICAYGMHYLSGKEDAS